eukprot:evm.model.scf_4821.1 EVM.evm.TU.scf_4821.1   scf_4821:1162-2028(+)
MGVSDPQQGLLHLPHGGAAGSTFCHWLVAAGRMCSARVTLRGVEDQVFRNLQELEATLWQPRRLCHGEDVLQAREKAVKDIVAIHHTLSHTGNGGIVRKCRGTSFLAVQLLDRYLALRPYATAEQVAAMGWAAYWVAAKHDNGQADMGWRISLYMLLEMGVQTKDLIANEWKLLAALSTEEAGAGWRLDLPTPYSFLEVFLAVVGETLDGEVGQYVQDVLESSLVMAGMLSYRPSMVAKAAVDAVLGKLHPALPYHSKLEAVSGYSQEDIQDCQEHVILAYNMHPMQS